MAENNCTLQGNDRENATDPKNHESVSSKSPVLKFSQPPPQIFSRPPPDLRGSASAAYTMETSRNPRYKTEICRNFKEGSKCTFGNQCQFAHGYEELRDYVRNSKYKTKLCHKYFKSGFCAYGPRCNFLHNEDETSSANEIQPSRNVLLHSGEELVSHLASDHSSNNPSPISLIDMDNLASLDELVALVSRSNSSQSSDPFLDLDTSIDMLRDSTLKD